MSFETVGRQKRPDKIVIHHSSQSTDTYEGILKYHEDKWGTGVGYHYLIYQDEVMVGRPTYHKGAHSSKANNGSIGFCFVGNYMTSLPSEKAINNAARFVAVECFRYNIPVERIFGHREVGSTDCPGDALFDYLPIFRSKVKSYLVEMSATAISHILGK